MPIVKVGDQRIKFPDDMSQEQISSALQAKFPQPKGILGAQGIQEPVNIGRKLPEELKGLPELQESGLLAGQSQMKIAALSPALLTATDPNEIAQIIKSNFPDDIGLGYNRDDAGNLYPVLTNRRTGAVSIINKPGISGMDIVQGLGLAAAYTPAGKAATIPAAIGRSMATETAIQAGQAASGGEFNPEEVALSGIFGGGLKAAESGIGGIYRASKGTPQTQLTKEASEAQIPLLTSDVLPPNTFAAKALRETGEKIPIVGTGEVRAAQQQLRNEAVDRIAQKYGEFSYDAIVNSLKTQKDRVKKAAGSVLEKTGQKVDEIGEIPVQNTQNAINEAKSILDKPGVITSSKSLGDLSELSDALAVPQTFTSLKENRTAFREILDSVDPIARSQLTSREKSILSNVYDSMTKDMDAAARQALSPAEFSKWKKASSVYAEESKKLTKSRIKNVLDKGDITPESVETLLFSKKPSEVKSLYQSLTPEGRSNARSALISKVVKDATKPSGGLTANSFVTSLNRFEPQINSFFKGPEKQQLEGLKRVLQATARAQDAAVTTPTGQGLFTIGTALSGAVAPIETLLTAGTIASTTRLYESAPVRNALLRLASVPRGSTAFDRALKDAVEALTIAAQSSKSLEPVQELREQK